MNSPVQDIPRRKTTPIKVGGLVIGGGFPISVQTMWKEPLRAADDKLLARIAWLGELGCDLLRFSVPKISDAELLGELAALVPMPLVADIHFDYRIALRCLDTPIAKLRINPGNIGAEWKVEEVLRKAADKNVPIRIGVNAGSLPKIVRGESDRAEAMVKTAELELKILERMNFRQAVFSLKSSDVRETVDANLSFSRLYDYPLHLGVTEAGPLIPGVVKNTLAIAELLKQGVGDTLRISLSESPEQEIITGKAILNTTGIQPRGVELISCPTCGRSQFDVKTFLEQVKDYIHTMDKNVRIAVMGCPVNGPGEARHADLGVTGSGSSVLFFKKGKIIRRDKFENAAAVFKEEVDKL
jgi:(E)-4-hydroxy-3-methylbut-2-enyl-diphosphate synthase